jgi:hypothetical protein
VRTLLAHSLRPLAAALVAILVISSAGSAVTVPSPIGKLSDYGAVFDRHGRDEVNASITEISKLLSIDVYILMSWESPVPTVAQFADAVFSAWGLGSRRAILAVFLREGLDWTADVVASASVRTQLGTIDQRLEQRMSDLVAHRRVEEAVRTLFHELRDLPAAQRASAALAKTEPTDRRGVPIALAVGGPIGLATVLALLIRWRVCPRCAGILRAKRSRFGSVRGARRVYSCRRCGYRRGR